MSKIGSTYQTSTRATARATQAQRKSKASQGVGGRRVEISKEPMRARTDTLSQISFVDPRDAQAQSRLIDRPIRQRSSAISSRRQTGKETVYENTRYRNTRIYQNIGEITGSRAPDPRVPDPRVHEPQTGKSDPIYQELGDRDEKNIYQTPSPIYENRREETPSDQTSAELMKNRPLPPTPDDDAITNPASQHDESDYEDLNIYEDPNDPIYQNVEEARARETKPQDDAALQQQKLDDPEYEEIPAEQEPLYQNMSEKRLDRKMPLPQKKEPLYENVAKRPVPSPRANAKKTES